MFKDADKKALYDTKLEHLRINLENNNMLCDICENADEAKALIKSLIEDKSSVSVGGSQTLFETGIIDMLREMDINFMDRYQDGLTREDQMQIYRDTFNCDYYLASSNAISMQGDLYNIDGNGNRVAAMIFGPKKVILVVGLNKICADMADAEKHLREVACPANNIRLHKDNPCTKIGRCVECKTDTRICSSFVRLSKQCQKDRIHIIVIKDYFGY